MLKQDPTRPSYRWIMTSLELAFGCEHELQKPSNYLTRACFLRLELMRVLLSFRRRNVA